MRDNKIYYFNHEKTEDTLMQIPKYLKAPISEKLLASLCQSIFHCGDRKQTDFVLKDSLRKGWLHLSEGYIYSRDLLVQHPIKLTAKQAALQQYIPTLYKEAVESGYYGEEYVNAEKMFQWLSFAYPGLIENDIQSLMMWMSYDIKEEHLSKQFSDEFNGTAEGWFSDFFTNPDCRIWIKDIVYKSADSLLLNVYLIPGKKGKYKKAYEHYAEFCSHIKDYIPADYLAVNAIAMQNLTY